MSSIYQGDSRQHNISPAELHVDVVRKCTYSFFYSFICSSDVGAETPTQISPKCHDTEEAFPHQHAQPEKALRECEGPAGGQPFGCITSVFKEEPSDLVIKWEVCEGSLLHQHEGQHGAEYQQKPAKKGKLSHCCHLTVLAE